MFLFLITTNRKKVCFMVGLVGFLLLFQWMSVAFSQEVNTLAEILKQGSRDERVGAVKQLGTLKGKKVVAVLIDALHDPERIVQAYAIKGLTGLKEEAVLPLIATLKEGDILAKLNGLSVLGNIGDSRAVDSILNLLQHNEDIIRTSAMAALGQLGDQKAVAPIITLFEQERDAGVQRVAIKVLGRLHDKRAIPPLVKSLEDEDILVREDVVTALTLFSAEEVVVPLLLAHSKNGERISTFIVQSLVRMGSVRIFDSLVAQVKGSDRSLALSAIVVLGALRDKRSVALLSAMLDSDDKNEKKALVIALGMIGDRKAIKPLVTLLKDRNKDIRSETALMLGKLKSEEAIEPLLGAIWDVDRGVRISVVSALAEIGGDRAVEELLLLSERSADDAVVTAAQEALSKMNDLPLTPDR